MPKRSKMSPRPSSIIVDRRMNRPIAQKVGNRRRRRQRGDAGRLRCFGAFNPFLRA